MFKVYLKNGVERWVDKREARLLQGKGQVVCVLEMKDEEADTVETLFFCDIKNGFCDVPFLASAPLV